MLAQCEAYVLVAVVHDNKKGSKKMKKLIAVVALLFSMQSYAGLINIDLDGVDEVKVGESVSVSLALDGFDPFNEFEIAFLFDDTLFEYVSGSVSFDLPDDGFDSFFAIDDPNDPFGLPGELGFSFFTFLDESGNYLIEFDLLAISSAIDAAVFSLDAVDFRFDDGFDVTTLIVDSSSTANVLVSEVSAPLTLSLVIMSIAGLAARRFSA
jgi:hypothetical protein